MTLRTRTLTALALTVLALIVVLPTVTSVILTDRFRSLEDADARRDAGRAEDAFAQDLVELGRLVEDWAWRDATWRFVQGREPTFAADKLQVGTFESLDLDVVVLMDRKGRVVWGQTRGPDGLEPISVDLAVALRRQIGSRTLTSPEDLTTGVVALNDGVWMLALAPILRTDRTGPALGAMVLGARLDARRVYELSRVTHVAFEVVPYGDALAELGIQQIPALGHVRLGPPEGEHLPAAVTLAGLGGQPAALLRLRLDRGVWRVGVQTQRYVVGSLLLVGAVLCLVAGLIVERFVLRGLASLTEAVGRLGRIGAAGGRLVVSGGDELSTLAGRINRMLEDLERTDAARNSADRRLALALDAANDGWWDWDVAGRSAYFSPRWCTMLGFAPGEMDHATGTALDLVHPEDLGAAQRRLRSHLRGASPAFECEVRMRTSTGEWIWVLTRGRVVERDVEGRALRMVGTQADISERKRMEARLVVSDRLASVGTLAAGVAHEINNPLSYVLTNLDLAVREVGRHPELAATREALEEAAEGAARVRDIVRDMKLFSRDQVDYSGVDLARVVDVATRMTAHEVRTRATLVAELDEIPLVTGSEARLGQVLVNLIVNAAQAMPPDRTPAENRITVRARRDPHGEVVVEVKDNGVGMDVGVQRRVFDPFFTTKPVGVGTGLGLYICHSLVASFGGRIDLVSVPGEGTTVRVTLPVWRGAGSPSAPPALSLVQRRLRTLIIDDEPAIGASLRRVLADTCETVVVADGRAGLDLLEADQDFDLILCDLVMPELDGPGFYAALSVRQPQLLSRVVFSSGGAATPALHAFLDRVPNQVLDKPFSVAALLRVLAAGREAA